MPITTVGLDADDTLWHNETIFRLTQARFLDLLGEHETPPSRRGWPRSSGATCVSMATASRASPCR